jgi:hypothetical protein
MRAMLAPPGAAPNNATWTPNVEVREIAYPGLVGSAAAQPASG